MYRSIAESIFEKVPDKRDVVYDGGPTQSSVLAKILLVALAQPSAGTIGSAAVFSGGMTRRSRRYAIKCLIEGTSLLEARRR